MVGIWVAEGASVWLLTTPRTQPNPTHFPHNNYDQRLPIHPVT